MAANQTVTVYGKFPPRYIEQQTTSKRSEVYGLNFPLGTASGGEFFTKNSGVSMIRDSVRQLLTTERGERVMLPNFGCNLKRFLFQPLDESTFESIKREILFSFKRYIVGAEVAKLAVFPLGEAGPAGGNSLKVVLTLRLDTADLEIFDVEVDIS